MKESGRLTVRKQFVVDFKWQRNREAAKMANGISSTEEENECGLW